ncbi:MAG TPA: hypothetical protein VKB80_35145, partial [Kofleriaceae bacterium]|nr:hypothetical protein [Kofleriaceae bacterium]
MSPARWSSPIAIATMAAVLVGGAGAARAGRTPFGWGRATEVVPERGVELETWVFEKNGMKPKGDADGQERVPDETTLWWMTVIGLTDHIELAVPVELRHLQVGDTGGDTLLYAFGAEARARLVSPDPIEAGPFAPVLRLGVHRLVNARKKTRTEGGFALGIDMGPRVHAVLDVGATWIAGDGESDLSLTPAAGISIELVGQLRAGGEVYGELTLDGKEPEWLAAGPNLAWTHGRFWISGAMAIGIIDINAAPRINWGV